VTAVSTGTLSSKLVLDGDPERTRGRKYHPCFSNTFDFGRRTSQPAAFSQLAQRAPAVTVVQTVRQEALGSTQFAA
jgi:hypothetical protein